MNLLLGVSLGAFLLGAGFLVGHWAGLRQKDKVFNSEIQRLERRVESKAQEAATQDHRASAVGTQSREAFKRTEKARTHFNETALEHPLVEMQSPYREQFEALSSLCSAQDVEIQTLKTEILELKQARTLWKEAFEAEQRMANAMRAAHEAQIQAIKSSRFKVAGIAFSAGVLGGFLLGGR